MKSNLLTLTSSLLLMLSLSKVSYIDQTNFYKGLEPKTNFYTETGYVSIDSEENQLFYHLFLQEGIESLDDVTQDQSFILWLNGGPGCSSLISVFETIGPYHVIPDGEEYTIKKSDSSWSQLAHTIFVDQPYNVGLSYGGVVKDTSTSSANLVNFLIQFFTARPQLQKTKFYVFGVSYGGHYVPGLGATILESEELMKLTNFQGIGVGNGWTDPINQFASYSSLFKSLGVMSDKNVEYTETQMSQAQQNVMDKNYLDATKFGFYGIFMIIDQYTGKLSPYSFQDYEFDMTAEEAQAWFINKYKDQFNAPKNLIYEQCNQGVSQQFILDISNEQKSSIEKILKQNKRVIMYNGSIDLICNTPGINRFLNTLNWDKISQWKQSQKKKWTALNEKTGNVETAGTIKKFDNLYFATIYRAGHSAPFDQPVASVVMLDNFLNDKEWN